MSAQVFTGAAVFDGTRLYPGASLHIEHGRVAYPGPGPAPGEVIRLDGGILAPGFLDLQVNGAGGRMVDGSTTADWLAQMCDIHARLGATGILPTLITDTAEATASVIAAGVEAARRQTPGFLGLHLEGPHLDSRRKGAHDPALIRPMEEEDLARLLEAAGRLPSLMVTLAPASATAEQIARLAAAGVIVSLGHSDCTHAEAKAAMTAGASCVTHLFNAMSQLGNRDPGLVGAALTGPVHAGLIADGIHVAPETIRVAMAASDRLFLVSDAMAAAGSDLTEFTLNGRRILRLDGSLRLEDGTLAGADLALARAVALTVAAGATPETALAMATSRPAACLRRSGALGHLLPGRVADMVHLGPDLTLRAVWRAGRRIV
jgi:N-acetylglucosamine-6-phosphate deacetylase